jgi:hypothetical protein
MSASKVLFGSWLVLSFVAKRDTACEVSHLVLSNIEGVVLICSYVYLAEWIKNTINLDHNEHDRLFVYNLKRKDSNPIQGESSND